MKKLSTLLTLACLCGASAASAITPQVADVNGMQFTATPAQQQHLRMIKAQAEFDALHQTNQENYDTRTWVDPRTGNVWTMQFMREQKPLCQLIGFVDDKGQPFQYTFEQLPLYCVTYVIWMAEKETGNVVTNVSFQMCWPSYYIWNQAFEWEGDLDENNDIPYDERNYAPVTPDDLMNSTEYCRKFVEQTGIGGKMTADNMNWEYFTMLPNQLLGFQGMVNGLLGYTTIGETRSSEVEFAGYKEEGNVVSYKQIVYFSSESGRNFIIRNEPVGSARIEGFAPRVDDLADFGTVHLFNMGLGGRDIYGEVDLYPEEWGPLSQLYLVAADQYVDVYIPEDMTKFDYNEIQTFMSERLPAGEDFDLHANIVRGVLYADPKYSQNTNEDPKEILYEIVNPTEEFDPVMEQTYLSVAPVANSFVAYGIGMDGLEAWSEDYGMQLRVHNFLNYFDTDAEIVFGSTKGFVMSCRDYYGNEVNAYSEGKCVYHYDPNNVKLTREFDLKGGMQYDSVETVVADAAKVVAANGEIAVSATEDSEVYVYSVAGTLVKAANVKAGNTVNVAADNGLYVVVVNGKAVKVAL